MGLISTPFRGLLAVFEKIAERAEEELYDEEAVRTELTEAYQQLEAGELSEEAFEKREAELVERLEMIEARKRAQARGGR